MKSNRFKLVLVIVMVLSGLLLWGQEKSEKEKKTTPVKTAASSGVQSGVEGGVEGGVSGGVEGGVSEGVEGGVIGGFSEGVMNTGETNKKIVMIGIKILEVKATETKLISSPKVTTRDGKAATIEMGTRIPVKNKEGKTVFYANTLKVKLTPEIIPEKGIELSIDVEDSRYDKKTERISVQSQGKKALVKNFETVTLDVIEREDDKARIVVQATPMIQISQEAEPLPSIEPVHIRDYLVIINDKVLYKRGGLTFDSNEAMFFFVAGKGLYLLSFQAFEGAAVAGEAEGSRIRLTVDGDEIVIAGSDDILPQGKWQVWVRRLKNFKGEGTTIGAGSLKKLLENF